MCLGIEVKKQREEIELCNLPAIYFDIGKSMRLIAAVMQNRYEELARLEACSGRALSITGKSHWMIRNDMHVSHLFLVLCFQATA